MTKHKWEWLLISPGVIALSGTPFQIRVEYRTCILHDQQITERVFSAYDGDNKISSDITLGLAKRSAELKGDDLVDMGMIETE